jgi:hypothetical protein
MPRNKLAMLRALLRKAEDAEDPQSSAYNPAEAATFRGKAFELAAEYEIEEAELFAKGETAEKVTSFTRRIAKPVIQKMSLMTTIANNYSCDVIRLPEYVLHVFGFKGDLDRVQMLYDSLVVQGERECRRSSTATGRLYRRFARSFWAHYTDTLAVRIRNAHIQTERSVGHSTELVLRDRKTIVTESVAAFYPSLKEGRRGSARRASRGSSSGSFYDQTGPRRTAKPEPRPGKYHIPNQFPHLNSKNGRCMCLNPCCLGPGGCRCRSCNCDPEVGHIAA